MQAAFDGSKEVAFTILSMTLSLVAVFIPVLFMGGIVGRLLHEFAVTITAAILISGFVSISLTPMLCSRFLHPPRDSVTAASTGCSSGSSIRGAGVYSHAAREPQYRFVTAAVSVVLMVATVHSHPGAEGLPAQRRSGAIQRQHGGAQGISFDEMVRINQVADVLLKDPNIASAGVNVGQMGNNATGGSNQGRMFVELKPRAERDVTSIR